MRTCEPALPNWHSGLNLARLLGSVRNAKGDVMKLNAVSLFLVGFLTVGAANHASGAEVARVFGDHMVLQQGMQVPIFGKAVDGEKVTVSFGGQTKSATAKDGTWRVLLDQLQVSKDPRTLTIVGGGKTVELQDVLVGEVWLGSGQSNMAGRVGSYAKRDPKLAELAATDSFPMIRLNMGGTWVKADKESVGKFSALCFAFGERLQRELDVPVGLMVGAVGGTPSGSWVTPESFMASERCKAEIDAAMESYDRAAAKTLYERQLAKWEKTQAEAKAAGKKARGRKPTMNEGPGTSSRGGAIGGLYNRHIRPLAGYGIRGVLWDQGEARSGVHGVTQYTMMCELIESWRNVWQQGDFPFLFVQKPSGGGAAFDQSNPITNKGQAFVNKLPKAPSSPAGRNGEKWLDRYMYVRLMHDNTNAWMVPAIDLGATIHPTNKWGYGNRSAEVALSQTYKDGTQAYGPIYTSSKVDGKKVRLAFDQVGKGLTKAHGETLQGFAVADKSGTWHWATATIEGNEVVAWSDDVNEPTKVSYAYADRREWANLYNKDGLPALSFVDDVK